MDSQTLTENLKTYNSKTTRVVSAVCGRCGQMSTRRGALLFAFDVELFLCKGCVSTLEHQRLEDYRRASTLIEGGVA